MPVLEVAVLDVRPGEETEFETNFRQARAIIAASPGHIGHRLGRCIEKPSRYILLVEWERLEDHTIGFRQDPRYQEWKSLLHRFYDPFPEVEHYEDVPDLEEVLD